MRTGRILAVVALALFFSAHSKAGAASGPTRAAAAPNIVIFLADDLGYGDLESYGHPVSATPALTKLASEGQRWTQFYAAAPVCTPSRGSLLTGRLPARLGLEAPAGMPNVFFSFSTGGLPHREITIAELARQHGYRTALIGKWHLGPTQEYAPTRNGFDYFFGILSSNDHDPAVPFSMKLFFEEPTEEHWALPLYRNTELIEKRTSQAALTSRLTQEALAFMQADSERPFLLVVAYAMPHTPLFVSAPFKGKTGAGLYWDAVAELDDSVGKITDVLRSSQERRKSLVLFTSDNGPADLFRERGGSAGLLRGGKGTTWEGGMRVPAIFWGPGIVRPEAIMRDLGSQLDLFPTIAELIGASLPRDRAFDGTSLRASLTEGAPSGRQNLFYYRAGEIYAVREGRFKAHFITADAYTGNTKPQIHAPPLIYDLMNDPSERYAIENPNPDLVARMIKLRTDQIETVPVAPSELIKGLPERPPSPKVNE